MRGLALARGVPITRPTSGQLARELRFPHELYWRVGAHTFAQSQAGIDALNTSAVEYQYVNNPTGDGMVTRFANGVRMILRARAGMAPAA